MAENNVTKIYELKTLGYADIQKQLDNVAKGFDKIKKAKQDAQAGLYAAQDNEEAKKFTAELIKQQVETEKLRTREQELRAEKQSLLTQQKAASVAKQAEIKASKDLQNNLQYEVNSYKDIIAQQKLLRSAVQATSSTSGTSIAFQGNSLSYSQAITQLKQLSAAEQDFRRQFTQDKLLVGEYTSGIVQAFKQMGLGDLIGGQITKANEKLQSLDTEAQKIKQSLSSIGVNGAGSLEKIQNQLLANRQEAEALRTSVRGLEDNFRSTGSIGTQITESITNGFKQMKGQLGNLIIQYFGFMALFNGITKTITLNKELSDSFVDLQRILGITSDQFDKVSEGLRNIDTRASLKQLTDFAIIAAKAGTSADEITEVTKSLDQLYLVAGKSLGDPEKTFESLVKLNTIFNNGAPATGDALQKLGNAIVQLDQAGVASGEFIVDYTERLAGIEGVTKIQIASVLGLAAAFQENGAKAEVAASATNQVILKLYSNTQKYAGIAHLTKQAFEDLLNSNPGEALLKVAAGLKGNAKSATEFASNFSELEAKGVRVQATMGILADRTDYFRGKMELASKALLENDTIIDGAANKQENFAAIVDKVGKEFEIAFSSPKFVDTLKNIANILLLVVKTITAIPFAVWITGISLVTAGYALMKGNVVAATLAQDANNESALLGITRRIAERLGLISTAAARAAATTATVAQTEATLTEAAATEVATAATVGLNTALKISPLGIILGIIGLVVPVVVAFSQSLDKNTDSVNSNNAATKDAVQNQKDLSKELNNLQNNIVPLLDRYDQLKAKTYLNRAEQTELQSIIAKVAGVIPGAITQFDKYGNAMAINTQKAKEFIETEKARLNVVNQGAIEQYQNQSKLLKQQLDASKRAADEIAKTGTYQITEQVGGSGGGYGSTTVTRKANNDELKKFVADRQQVGDRLKGVNAEIARLSGTSLDNLIKEAGGQTGKKVETFTPEVDIPALKSNLKDLTQQIDGFKGTKKDLEKLISDREALQKKLNDLEDKGKHSTYDRGSRVGGTTKDALKDQDAARDALLVTQETARAQNEISEREYLQRIQKINDDALAKKIDAIKGSNSAENALRAKYRLDRIKNSQETNDKIFDIDKKALDKTLDDQKKSQEDKVIAVNNDPNSTNEQRAQVRLDADLAILSLEKQYAADLNNIEQATGQQSIKNAKAAADAIRETNIKIATDQKGILEGSLKDVQTDLADQQNIIAGDTAVKTTAILTNAKLTQMEKARQINELEKVQTTAMYDAEIAALQKTVDLKKQQYDQGLINQKQYTDAVTKLHEKEAEAARNSSQVQQTALSKLTDSLKDGWNNIKSIFTGGQKSTVEQQEAAMQQSLDTVTNAINKAEDTYFQSKNNQVDKERDTAKAGIQAQEDQALKYASTEEEKAYIRDKYQKLMDEEDKKAAEKKKKIALQQATIDFAAAVIKTFAQFGWPLGLIPVAALGIQYAIQRATIANTQFEQGGQVPTRGGKFGGRPHSEGGTPFGFQGNSYEAEVGELAIIRTKSAPAGQKFTINGTQEQIASALNRIGGGIDFSRGASITQSKFAEGGVLGTNYPIPVFTPHSNVSDRGVQDVVNIVNRQSAQIQAMAAAVIAVSNQVQRIEVVQTTSTVTKAQQKQVKQAQIGTL